MGNNIQELLQSIVASVNRIADSYHFSDKTSTSFSAIITLSVLVGISVLFYYLAKGGANLILRAMSKYLKIKYFNLLNKNNFHTYLSLWLSFSIVNNSVEIVFVNSVILASISHKLLYILLVVFSILSVMAIVSAGFDTLRSKENYHDRPINSYLQVIRILLIIFGFLLVLSDLTNQSWQSLFTALGAASALFVFMFKDMIMGFVASVQVTSNDMVRIGDWITMPKYGADGDVIEISLTTVKVSNFDMTITTIPTYALISDSFQNWRGMFRSGGRRIKRSILIKQSSIRYITDDELVRFRKIQGIADFIDRRQEEIRLHNISIGADRSIPVNGRNLTNAGLFRKYTEWYLNNHPGTNKEMILMVRQMQPTEMGMPLELYAFTNTTKWVDYEYIMADIFDHLIAAMRYFDLHVFERQAGSDVQRVEMVEDDFNPFERANDSAK